jgi:hypothetical protein
MTISQQAQRGHFGPRDKNYAARLLVLFPNVRLDRDVEAEAGIAK